MAERRQDETWQWNDNTVGGRRLPGESGDLGAWSKRGARMGAERGWVELLLNGSSPCWLALA